MARRGVMGAVAATAMAVMAGVGANAPAQSLGGLDLYTNEPPSNFLPGKYYFSQAKFYLGKGQVPAAVEMLELASWWGHKFAQYDLGVLYFNGMGTGANRPLGAAWFGIAAQNHGSLADQTLQQAWEQLTAEERAAASGEFDRLLSTYSDAQTQFRAKERFAQEQRKTTGSHLGGFSGSNVSVIGRDGLIDHTHYLAEQQRELADSLGLGGRVDIGNVQTIGLDGRPKSGIDQRSDK